MAKTLFGFAKRVARQQIRKQVRKALKPRKAAKPQQKRSRVSDRKQEFLDRWLDFLRGKWDNVFLPDGTIADGYEPWYGDPATERQLNKLQELGVEVQGKLNKGQASNLIGLYYPIDNEDKEKLRFLKIELKGHNQTSARYLLREEFWSNEENLERWENRPLTGIQRDFFKFMNIPMPGKLTVKQFDEIESSLTDEQEDSKDYREYLQYVDTYEGIVSCDDWKDYLKRKPSLKLYKEIWAELREKGTDMEEVYDSEIFDAIVERYPELESDY